MRQSLLGAVTVLSVCALTACGAATQTATPQPSGSATPSLVSGASWGISDAPASPLPSSPAGQDHVVEQERVAGEDHVVRQSQRPSSVPTGVVDEDSGETIGARPVPTWDEPSRAEVVAAAETVIGVYARPDLEEDAWRAGMQPLLSEQAGRDYAYVDPANVPPARVSGPGAVVEDTSAFVATVQVPTDVGPYRVMLSRADAAAPWLAERITPPEEVG